MKFEQGDIIKVEGLKTHFLVVSTNFFNLTEQAILCPIVKDTFPDALHIKIDHCSIDGLVMCEQMKLYDLRIRGWKKIDRVRYEQIIDITDALQSIFDYR